MDNKVFHEQLALLFAAYTNVIKPLIIEIEVRYEQFPAPIYNEIRAFNDHIARCYSHFPNEEVVKQQIKKTKGHIERAILDCYKYLNVAFYKELIEKFDKKTKRIDLSAVNNGVFYAEYKKYRQFVIENLKEAKRLEAKEDKKDSLDLYEQVYNKYSELEKLIMEHSTNIKWARAKFFLKNRCGNIIIWVFTIIISAIVGAIIQNNFKAIFIFFNIFP